MFTSLLFQRILIGFAVVTALGILVHDTKFDEAVALTLPIAVATFGAGAHALEADNGHTHVERVSLGHSNPRAQARDDRKYLISKYLGRNSFFGESGVVWPHV